MLKTLIIVPSFKALLRLFFKGDIVRKWVVPDGTKPQWIPDIIEF